MKTHRPLGHLLRFVLIGTALFATIGLLAALRQRIDAVFLPRPPIFVDALPRNGTGKLPRSALQALYAEKTRHAGR